MVRVSFDQKPYRRALMETYGATCIASRATRPTPAAPSSPPARIRPQSRHRHLRGGRGRRSERDTKYSLGSVLNHVLLHQTVIGQEAIEQMEAADAYPDVVIGCAGGGSNFGGIAFPFSARSCATSAT